MINKQITEENLKNIFLPYKTNFNLIRIGSKHDGGYVVPKELLESINRVISFGIEHNIDFEKDILKLNPNAKIDGYDYTVNLLPGNFKSENFIFHQKKIDIKDEGISISPNTLFQNENKYFILKSDIEGEEFNFVQINPENIKKAGFIVLEVHWIFNNFEKFLNLMKYLNDNGFTIIHIHENNHGNIRNFGSFSFPDVFEITFVNNDLISEKNPKYEIYPQKIDSQCNQFRGNFTLDFSTIKK